MVGQQSGSLSSRSGQINLGNMYATGVGGETNLRKAAAAYEKVSHSSKQAKSLLEETLAKLEEAGEDEAK